MNLSGHGIVAVLVVVCSSLLVIICLAKAQGTSDEPLSTQQESLKRFLQSLDKSKSTRYIAAFRDIDDDGIPEAIVYLIGRNWCGSGGCNTLVLARDGTSWRIVATITITRPPIRVLPDTSNGWHSIGVWVQGGGIQPGYEVELRFDGKTYPKNPSVPPARRLEKSTGEIVIPSAENGTPLYAPPKSRLEHDRRFV